MELYKWYKGDELPDRECDCVVVYRVTKLGVFRVHGVFRTQAHTSQYKVVARVFLDRPSTGELGFCDCDDVVIPRDWVIAYMPIEFPKEVS